MSAKPPPPPWRTVPEAARLILTGATACVSVRTSLIVGTLLTLVNQSAVLLSGELTRATPLRVLANYAIPYVVAGVGYLSSSRVAADPAD